MVIIHSVSPCGRCVLVIAAGQAFLLEKHLTQADVTRQDILQEVCEVSASRKDKGMSHRCVIDLV